MRATWTIVLAICVALAGIRPHHARRSHPSSTMSAHVDAHHQHARARHRHRTAATVGAVVLVAAHGGGAVDLVAESPALATDHAAVVPVARGPPLA